MLVSEKLVFNLPISSIVNWMWGFIELDISNNLSTFISWSSSKMQITSSINLLHSLVYLFYNLFFNGGHKYVCIGQSHACAHCCSFFFGCNVFG